MRPDIGEVRADDGWLLEWDLIATPQAIRVYSTDRMDHHISGNIDHRYLDRTIRQFLRDHAAQQMVMEW